MVMVLWTHCQVPLHPVIRSDGILVLLLHFQSVDALFLWLRDFLSVSNNFSGVACGRIDDSVSIDNINKSTHGC